MATKRKPRQPDPTTFALQKVGRCGNVVSRAACFVAIGTLLAAAGCGGSSEEDRPAATPGIDNIGVSRDRVKGWPAAWCSLAPGVTRTAARKVMGAPTESYSDQDQWQGYGVHLTAFYDPELHAYQLDVNGGDIPCTRSRKANR